jgi:polysaccharide deacetylase 2 family uncharacterized protein YibQ
MPRDELRQPLKRRSLAERLWARRPSALAVASVMTLAIFAGGTAWLARLPHPFAGEPIVMVQIPPPEELQTSSTDPAVEQPAPQDSPDNQQIADQPVIEVQPDAYQDQATIIVASRRPMKAAPFAQVTEKTDDGPLPKTASNGRTPADLYAQAVPMGALASDRPKIAILLGGMGLNQALTAKAIHDLPGDITFGFAPYGDDLQKQVNQARAQGHEVMLQLPMEPMGYPANDPGPNTLLADADAAANAKSLHWNMSRFAGYTGITNYMGARFLAQASSLAPVLTEMKARGLLFLEDANVAVTATQAVAQSTGARTRHADLVIDADPDAASIRAALAKLEDQAKTQGLAVGTGSGLDVTIDTVADWARELESKGFLLVPVSATFKGRFG